MSTFRSLNRQLFIQKRRYAHLILLVQLFAIVFLTILFSINAKSDESMGMVLKISFSSTKNNFFAIPFGIALLSSILGDLIFTGLLCWQNEKVNNSQTFQLIPFSTNQIWLTNLFSSLLACAYIFVIQVVTCWLLAIPVEIKDKNNIFVDTGRILQIGTKGFWDNFTALEFVIVLVLLIFASVTFVNYASKIISEVLPVNNNNWLRFIIIAVIVVIGFYFASQINDTLNNYYIVNTKVVRENGGEFIYENPMWLENIEEIVALVIIGALDLWLGKKYWEPRRDH